MQITALLVIIAIANSALARPLKINENPVCVGVADKDLPPCEDPTTKNVRIPKKKCLLPATMNRFNCCQFCEL